MALYINGHSTDCRDETFIPAGKTVTFYTEEGEAMAFGKSLRILLQQGNYDSRQKASPKDGPLEMVKNYCFGAFSTDELDRVAPVAPRDKNSSMIIAGVDFPSDTKLCNGGCDVATGMHSCSGIFGTFKAPGEYRILACLGGHKQESDDYGDYEKKLQSQIDKFLQGAWTKQKEFWENALNDLQRAEFLTYSSDVREFLACLYVDNYAESRGGTMSAYRAYVANLQEEQERGQSINAYTYEINLYTSEFKNVKDKIKSGKEIAVWLENVTAYERDGDEERYAIAKNKWEGLSDTDKQEALAALSNTGLPDWVNRKYYTQQPDGSHAQLEDDTLVLGSGIRKPISDFDMHSIGQIKAIMRANGSGADWGSWVDDIPCIQLGSLILIGDDPSWYQFSSALTSMGAVSASITLTLESDSEAADQLSVSVELTGETNVEGFQNAFQRWNLLYENFQVTLSA
jgi:hypothetical protein